VSDTSRVWSATFGKGSHTLLPSQSAHVGQLAVEHMLTTMALLKLIRQNQLHPPSLGGSLYLKPQELCTITLAVACQPAAVTSVWTRHMQW
jgi:hypothetical protein